LRAPVYSPDVVTEVDDSEMIQSLLLDLLPLRNIAMFVLVAAGLQLLGIDVIGMVLDFAMSLVPETQLFGLDLGSLV